MRSLAGQLIYLGRNLGFEPELANRKAMAMPSCLVIAFFFGGCWPPLFFSYAESGGHLANANADSPLSTDLFFNGSPRNVGPEQGKGPGLTQNGSMPEQAAASVVEPDFLDLGQRKWEKDEDCRTWAAEGKRQRIYLQKCGGYSRLVLCPSVPSTVACQARLRDSLLRQVQQLGSKAAHQVRE